MAAVAAVHNAWVNSDQDGCVQVVEAAEHVQDIQDLLKVCRGMGALLDPTTWLFRSDTEDIEFACSDPDQEKAAQIVEAVGNEGEADKEQEATDGDDEEEHGASQLHQLRQNISSEQLFKALYSEWEMGLLTLGMRPRCWRCTSVP